MTVSESEKRILDLLRPGYIDQGFTFIEYPSPAELPAFMRGYQPDALALGSEKSIAIEVKTGRSQEAVTERLRSIRDRFSGQPEWEFRVVYADEYPLQPVFASTKDQINSQIAEAELLLSQDHASASLVLGWAAIEAIARTIEPDFPSRGVATMTRALELLEHLGRLHYEDAERLRRILPLRAKIVHGDFQTRVTREDVEPVLRAARTALQAA